MALDRINTPTPPPQGNVSVGDLQKHTMDIDFFLNNCSQQFEDINNIKNYGAVTVNDVDNSTALQAAIDDLGENGGIITVPKGQFDFALPVTISSNIKLIGAGKSSLFNLLSSAVNDFIIQSDVSGNLNNVKIQDLAFKNNRTSVSGVQSMINIDGVSVDSFSIYDCFFENQNSFCDSIFFKAASGRTMKGIRLHNITFENTKRMHVEFINHDNSTSYNIQDIKISNCIFNECDFINLSVSGAIKGVDITSNTFRTTTTSSSAIGVELVGTNDCNVAFNGFSGNYGQSTTSGGMISSSDSNDPSTWSSDGRNINLISNYTEGQVDGRVFLKNFGSGKIIGNNFNLTKQFILDNTKTSNCIIQGNTIKTDGVYAIIAQNSPDHIIDNNILDNSTSSSNFATMRAFGSLTTGLKITNNKINKGTGGTHIDTVSGGQIFLNEANILDGELQDKRLDSDISLNKNVVTTASTTSTAVITFKPSSSWRPATVKVTCSSCTTGGGHDGCASSIFSVRHLNTSTTIIQIQKDDILTNADLVLSSSYLNNVMTVTATVPASGIQVLWSVDVVGFTEIESITYS